MLDRLREYEEKHLQPTSLDQAVWADVKPGMLTMHIVSLHVFVNDYVQLFGKEPPK